MLCYRIGKKAYVALDGEDARLHGGRWNSPGQAAVYTAGSIALAALEYLVHVDIEDVPDDLVVLTIEVPDTVVGRRIDVESLSAGWALPSGALECRARGDAWLTKGTEAILRVPAAIIPEEDAFILNPRHPDARDIIVRCRRRFVFDARLLE